MAKTGSYFHASTITTDVTAVASTYDANKQHAHPLYVTNESIDTGSRFKGRIETIIVRVTNMTSSPTSIFVTGACDSDGDYIWFPETEAEISTGITTNTTGSAVYEYKLPVKHFFDSNTMYLFFRTNTGTVTIDASCIVWSE
jgi:hypothetical protein